MPDLTVVVIGYNDVTNIATAVESVLRQTLHNLEVVIVDDASTDGTAEVANRLAAENPRVRAVHLPENSGGCSRPRNVGIEHARAPYVMFLDSDDVYERHACKNLLLEAERTGADVVGGKCVRVFLDRGGEKVWAPELFAERATYAGVRDNPGLFFDPLSTNKIYRRQFLNDGDIRFPEGVHYEDSLFSTKVYCQASLIAVIPNVVYYWNVVRDAEAPSITQRRNEFENFRDRIAVHRMIDAYLDTHESADLKVYKDYKFIRHDLRLYLRYLSARDHDYQRRFVALAADYLSTVSEQTLAMVNPVQRILVHVLRRQDIEETLKTITYLRHDYKLSTELVERDGRIYWSEKYLDTPEDRAIMDVTDLGLHRTPFSEQSLFVQVTTADFAGGRMRLEGRLLNQLGRISPDDDLALTFVVRHRGRFPKREFPATVLGRDGSHIGWSVDVDLARAMSPLDQLIPAWDVRMEVRWNGVVNAATLSVDPATLSQRRVTVRGRFGRLATGTISPYVTFNGNLSFEQASEVGVARRLGRLHALLQRAKHSLRTRSLSASAYPRAKRVGYKLFQRLPVKKGLTVFESHMGKQFSDSPKYIYEAARRAGFNKLGITPVWSYDNRPTSQPVETRRVLRNGWRYNYLLARAQYWVDNQGFPRVYTKRPATTYVQTWHGTPLKKMGWDEPRLAALSPAKRRVHEAMIERWDYLVVPSEYFVETFVQSYGYHQTLLRVGYPRNDLLVNRATDPEYVAEAKRRMGLPLDRTIVLYAPTFRDRGRGRNVAYSLPFDVEQLAESLRDDVFLLVRTHYLDAVKLSRGVAPFAKNVSDHDDITEILLVSDVLVTDYSSTMFDFANTGRPMIFYTHDYDDYVHNERGTYFKLADEAPGPLVTTTDELAACLADIDRIRSDYADRYTAWRERYCEYDKGHAADDVVSAVFGSGPAVTTAEMRARDLTPARSEKPRNVFIVANNVEGVGGLQRVAHNLAQELSRSGHHVVLVALNHHEDQVTYVSDPLYDTFTVYETREPKALPKASRLRRLSPMRRRHEARRQQARKDAVSRLSALFRSVPDGIVICMQIHVMAWVAQADTQHLRVIGQSHEQYEASRGWTAASRGVTRRYDGILRHYSDVDLFQLLTHVDAHKFEQDGLNNVAVMHNPLSFYPPDAAELTAKTVITVGRYEPQKDQRALIAAFAQVVAQRPDWSLELWGTGPLQDSLAEQIETLGLAGNVRLMGPTDDVQSALLRSSVFALSSDFEGLPVVLCEAMACGVPCVSVDCGPGIAEIIRDDEDGLIVTAGETDALAAALLRLIEDEPLRRAMGQRARENIRRFSVPEIIRQWEAVFDMVER